LHLHRWPQQLSGELRRRRRQRSDVNRRSVESHFGVGAHNGSIYLVGGSAGGCLALWCALDPLPTVSGWDETARSHIKAVVSLSGPTQLCDWSNPGHLPQNQLTMDEGDFDNYVNLPYLPYPTNCDPSCDFGVTCALDQ